MQARAQTQGAVRRCGQLGCRSVGRGRRRTGEVLTGAVAPTQGAGAQTEGANKMIVSHYLWPQQSLARDHVQHTALYLCALSAENDPFSTF